MWSPPSTPAHLAAHGSCRRTRAALTRDERYDIICRLIWSCSTRQTDPSSTHARTQTHTHAPARTHAHARAHTHTHLRRWPWRPSGLTPPPPASEHTHTNAHTHARMHARTRARAHTHTHTQIIRVICVNHIRVVRFVIAPRMCGRETSMAEQPSGQIIIMVKIIRIIRTVTT